jgi:DNA-binding transcriptional ArsR family regulator
MPESVQRTRPQRIVPSPAAEPADAFVATAKALSDRARVNVLRVLKEDSYGVLELCRVLDMAQPALSHHLKVLHMAGLAARRREGNTIFYRRAPAATAFHQAIFAAIDEIPLPEPSKAELERIHAERDQRSRAFFAAHADDFENQQARISEAKVYIPSVLELIDRAALEPGSALEIGPGEGELLCHLATRFNRVVAIDNEPAMLRHCAPRVAELENVRLLNRDFASLPTIARYQLVVAAMVLHHQASPGKFFHHARRLVHAGGLLVIVELCRHDHEWVRDACGDQWLGFEPQELAGWATRAGFVPGETQFLAQRNGFQIQILSFRNTKP